MATQQIKFSVADEINGVLETFDTIEEARISYKDAVEEGTKSNLAGIKEIDENGEEIAFTEDEAREADESFYSILKVTTTFDEDGDVESEDSVAVF